MRIKTIGAVAVGTLVTLAMCGPVAAQSTGPEHTGFDPSQGSSGHYHEGEIGAKLLVLEQALKCDCGCGLDVHSCQFQMQCGTSPVWSQRIRAALEAGESPDVIEASFVADFGPEVLMSPPPEGFNLVGYFLPAFAIITAGMLVGLVARGGVGRERPAPVEHVTDEDAERLRTAMEKMDAAESPDW